MGLSDQERRSGIFWAIRKIVKIARELPDSYQILKQLAEDLWPAYLGQTTNGLHWIFGSSASNTVKGENRTPWDTSIAAHIEEAFNEEEPSRREFDPLDSFLSIGGLLTNPNEKVYDIFGWTEQLIYYLRRYDDELLERLKKLSDIIDRIQGECFDAFASDNSFAFAYIGQEICEILYNRWVTEDQVKIFFDNDHMHHNIREAIQSKKISLKRLIEIHSELLRIRPENLKTQKNYTRRLLFALEIAGSKYHYEHQHQGLRTFLKERTWPEADLQAVDAVLEKLCKEETPKDSKKKYNDALFYCDAEYEEEPEKQGPPLESEEGHGV